MNDVPPFTYIVQTLPQNVPFIGPKTLERLSGKSIKLRLGANESSFGISSIARVAMCEAIEDVTLYGDPESYDLREKLADVLNIAMENIVVGSGIDDLLGLTVRTFIETGQIAVTSLGTYPTFNYHVAGYGGQIHFVPYRDFYNDLVGLGDAAKSLGARILYLANPDNPTGTYYPAEAIQILIDQLPTSCLLILDEAYIEFAPVEKNLPIKPIHPQIVRLRTFSKGYGLAGTRIGYAVADPKIISAFEKIRLHYGVNRIAQIGALASLQDPNFLKSVIISVEEGRREYESIAEELGLSVLPSATNFVAIDMGSAECAHSVVDGLFELGVFVRAPSVTPLNRLVRITIGTSQERATFSKVFRDVFNSNKFFVI